jgi:predicted small metal-binding protein
MDDQLYTNRCVCGWEVTGPLETVIDATIAHGQRLHNMTATRDDVIAALTRTEPPEAGGDRERRPA